GIRDFHVTGVQTCALPILSLDQWVTWNWQGARPFPWHHVVPREPWKRMTPPMSSFDPRWSVLPEPWNLASIRPGRTPSPASATRSEERRVGKAGTAHWGQL